MPASVIVTSYNSPATLRQCLRSLSQQPCGEIIVADSSEENPAPWLSREFPEVMLRRFPVATTVPVMRWAALQDTRFEVVLAVEARCVPESGWVQALEDAHARYPLVPAIGGLVAAGGNLSKFDWALFFCEYGRFAPPQSEAETYDLSGASLSYKRRLLEAEPDLLRAGAWETLLHLRWMGRGLKLVLTPTEVTFHNSMAPRVALRQRFHYGRGYAGHRARRWAYILSTPLLPVLLVWRIARAARRSRYACHFAAARPWVIGLTIAWCLGELTGYLAGPPRSARNF